jgi:Zn-dependent protease with chaperone function
MVAVYNSHLKNTSQPVTEGTEPRVHRVVKEASEKLGTEAPATFISPDPSINAYTRGAFSPVLVLNQGLLDVMDQDELRFIIGHELGHIKLNHFTIKTLLDDTVVRVPWLLYIPILVFKLLFLRGRLSRSMEYSADRAGLAVCGDLDKAVSTMIKLRTGRSVSPEMVRGAIGGSFQIDGERNILGQLLSTHPDLDDRVRELVRYHGTIRS